MTALSLGYFLVMLDVTVVTVAVPDVRASLGAGPAAMQWIVDGYSTVFAGLLLLGGGLGDRLGHRRVFMGGLTAFVAASAVCGAAGSPAVLVAGRLAQGAGAAFLVPASLALLQAAYPDRAVRARAIALWGAMAALAFGAGPAVGGLLLAGLDWRAAFWVNLPVGALALWLTARHVNGSGRRTGVAGRTDPLGQALGVVSLLALAGALNEAGGRGWTSPLVLGAAALGAAGLTVFVLVERRLERGMAAPGARQPLLRPSLFRNGAFSATAAVGLLISLGYYGMLYVTTLHFQQERGLDALATGLALLPSVCMGLLAAPLLSRLVPRTGPYAPMTCALFLGAAGFLTWLLTGPTPLALAATGLGQTTAALTATTAIIDTAPPEAAGLSTALFNTARQLGSALGVALFGTLTTTQGLTRGLHTSALLAAVAFAVAGVLSLRGWKSSRSHRAGTAKAAARERGDGLREETAA
ncbi:MFS transporter [Streptomyces mashuensis]|uniref:MFS transporter n=1 Tax=Streptomyces mashuensis TaxID=33904 RepID=A0A919B0G6_9ACTN|nr:MFS transporter [Streptomyces mashuensis]